LYIGGLRHVAQAQERKNLCGNTTKIYQKGSKGNRAGDGETKGAGRVKKSPENPGF